MLELLGVGIIVVLKVQNSRVAESRLFQKAQIIVNCNCIMVNYDLLYFIEMAYVSLSLVTCEG